MRRTILLLPALLVLVGSCASAPKAPPEPIPLKGDFGILEMFVGRKLLWQMLSYEFEEFHDLEFAIVENGDGFSIRHTINEHNKFRYELRKTARPGVFDVRQIPRSATGRDLSASLDPDGSLKIYGKDRISYMHYEVVGAAVRITPHQGNSRVQPLVQYAFEPDLLEVMRAAATGVTDLPGGVPLSIGETRTLRRGPKSIIYRFVGLAGTTVTAGIRTPGAVILTFYGPDGAVMGSSERADLAVARVTLPADDVYFLSIVRSDPTHIATVKLTGQDP